jgi:tetratricopeptide (TPR) repeat protein
VIPVADYAFDHRLYLPGMGLIVGFVLAVLPWLTARVRASVSIALTLALLGTLGVLTFNRNQDYGSEESMWRDVVDKRPANLRARNDLAVTLSERQAYEEALSCYQGVLDRVPPDVLDRLDRGDVVRGAIIPAISDQWNYFRAHANLGLLVFRTRHDAARAAWHYRRALGVNPTHAGLQIKLRRAEEALEQASQTHEPPAGDQSDVMRSDNHEPRP